MQAVWYMTPLWEGCPIAKGLWPTGWEWLTGLQDWVSGNITLDFGGTWANTVHGGGGYDPCPGCSASENWSMILMLWYSLVLNTLKTLPISATVLTETYIFGFSAAMLGLRRRDSPLSFVWGLPQKQLSHFFFFIAGERSFMLEMSMQLNCSWKYVKPQKNHGVSYARTRCLVSQLFVTASLSSQCMGRTCVYARQMESSMLKDCMRQGYNKKITHAPSNAPKAARKHRALCKCIQNPLSVLLFLFSLCSRTCNMAEVNLSLAHGINLLLVF